MMDRLAAFAEDIFVLSTLLFLLRAAALTLVLTVVGCTVGFVIGFALAVVRSTKASALLPLRVLATLYVEVFRRIPFLVILFIVLFTVEVILPGAPLLLIGLVAIFLLSSAYLAEIIRAGFDSIPRAQIEAATVMNFGFFRILRLVIVPQSWRVILPPAVAYAVMFVKDTALLSQAGVFELMFAGRNLVNRGFDPVLTFAVILALYVAITYPLARLGTWIERRLTRRLRPGAPARSV
jgi:polar amino acid transport system permease protein